MAFPFAASIIRKKRKKQLLSGVGENREKRIFPAKYLAVFPSGFVVISGTLLVNLAISAVFFSMWGKAAAFFIHI